jgi:hypothetical protein
MRASKVVGVAVVMVAIFAGWFMTAHAGPSAWPANKGEFCLYNTSNGETARIAAMRTVGNNYTVHGFTTETSGSKTLFDGNAIVDGDTVLMHISASGFNSARLETHGTLARVELEAATLRGNAMVITFHCEGDPALDDCGLGNDGVQPLEPVACE